MSGPTALRSQKALLTRYCNNLERAMDDESAVTLDSLSSQDMNSSQRLHSLVLKLNSHSQLVQEALDRFIAVVDSVLDSLNDEHQSQVQQYIDRAHALLDRAHTMAIEIESNTVSASQHPRTEATPSTPESKQHTGGARAAKCELPAIHFWTLFSANVHNQPLTNLQKFNYLLSALQGEARESIRRFPISEANYEHALSFLHAKYGDKTKFIASLQHRLESARSQDNRIPAQRRLLEFVMPIVTLLEEKGVQLQGSFLAQKFLSKFSPDLQRKVLQQRVGAGLRENDWSIQNIISDLDKVITTEERINEMVTRQSVTEPQEKARDNLRPRNKDEPRGRQSCIFCGAGDHRSLFCTKCASVEGRRAIFREHNRCLNCAVPGHWAKECTRDGCRACKGKKHHYTLCPLRDQQLPTAQPLTTPHSKSHPPAITKRAVQHKEAARGEESKQRKTKQGLAHAVETYRVESQENEQKDSSGTILFNAQRDLRECENDECTEHNRVLLLSGVARVGNSVHDRWREVEILFDTGADQSFITYELARDLGLSPEKQIQFMMYTFGTEKPKCTSSGVIRVNLLDQEGATHNLRLYTAPILTAKEKVVHLSTADKTFIAQHNIQLSKIGDGNHERPQILLGCDQLWNFLDVPYSRFVLPSGLQLIPSRIGYLLTGTQKDMTEPNINRKITTSTVARVVNTLTSFDEDLERWDKYWTMDNAGVCEFTGTKNAAWNFVWEIRAVPNTIRDATIVDRSITTPRSVNSPTKVKKSSVDCQEHGMIRVAVCCA